MNQKEAVKWAEHAIKHQPMPQSLNHQFELNGLAHTLSWVKQRTAEMILEHQHVSEAQKLHLQQILPCIAFYEALLKEDEQRAFALYEKWCLLKVEKMAKLIPTVMKIPGLYRLVPSIMKVMLNQVFNHESGFEYVEKKVEHGFGVDMISCPYVRACKKYGHPEIAQFFCKSDDLCYGSMHPKLVWGRSRTLGLNDECCDFKITIKKNE